MQIQIQAQERLRAAIGSPAYRTYEGEPENEEVYAKIKSFAYDKYYAIAQEASAKSERGEKFAEIKISKRRKDYYLRDMKLESKDYTILSFNEYVTESIEGLKAATKKKRQVLDRMDKLERRVDKNQKKYKYFSDKEEYENEGEGVALVPNLLVIIIGWKSFRRHRTCPPETVKFKKHQRPAITLMPSKIMAPPNTRSIQWPAF